MYNYEVTEPQYIQYLNWNKNHMCSFVLDSGTCGGRLTWCFTPTSLGLCVVVKCACGEELNLTDVEDW